MRQKRCVSQKGRQKEVYLGAVGGVVNKVMWIIMPFGSVSVLLWAPPPSHSPLGTPQ